MITDHDDHEPTATTPRLRDGEDFARWLLRRLMGCLDLREEANLDLSYPAFGARMDAQAYDAQRAGFLMHLAHHRDALFETYTLWTDDVSRELFSKLMLFRALGHERVRLPSNTSRFWQVKEQVAALPGQPSALQHLPGAGGLQHFDLNVQGTRVSVDCLRANVLFSFFLGQYHFSRGEMAIGPQPGDHALDVGSCFGDTAVDFARAVGPRGRVHCFELLDTHLAVLRHNIAQNPRLAPVDVHAFGLSDHHADGVVASGAADPGFHVGDGMKVPLRRLDDLVADGTVQRVDFVKMDIEGHEEAALRGAIQTLRRFRPRLAISLYHRWDDYHRIPLLLRDLQLGYRFYLDNYTISDGETVLYAVPQA